MPLGAARRARKTWTKPPEDPTQTAAKSGWVITTQEVLERILMPGCLFPGELSVLPSPGSWKGTGTVPAPLTCPWPPGRWGPGMWFCARSALAAAAGDTKIPLGMSTVVVQPDPTAVTGADVQGKLSPTLGKGRGTETIP